MRSQTHSNNNNNNSMHTSMHRQVIHWHTQVYQGCAHEAPLYLTVLALTVFVYSSMEPQPDWKTHVSPLLCLCLRVCVCVCVCLYVCIWGVVAIRDKSCWIRLSYIHSYKHTNTHSDNLYMCLECVCVFVCVRVCMFVNVYVLAYWKSHIVRYGMRFLPLHPSLFSGCLTIQFSISPFAGL